MNKVEVKIKLMYIHRCDHSLSYEFACKFDDIIGNLTIEAYHEEYSDILQNHLEYNTKELIELLSQLNINFIASKKYLVPVINYFLNDIDYEYKLINENEYIRLKNSNEFISKYYIPDIDILDYVNKKNMPNEFGWSGISKDEYFEIMKKYNLDIPINKLNYPKENEHKIGQLPSYDYFNMPEQVFQYYYEKVEFLESDVSKLYRKGWHTIKLPIIAKYIKDFQSDPITFYLLEEDYSKYTELRFS